VLTTVLTGRDTLAALGPRLDDLQESTRCPVTARRAWQQTWLDHFTAWSPLVVVVEGHDGDLRAAAPLAVRSGRVQARVVPIGHGPSDEVRLPARDNASARELATAVSDALTALRRPWLLVARQVDPDDAAVHALAEVLRWSEITPGEAAPRLAFQPDRSVRAHVSRNHHQQVRRMRNRVTRDGHALELAQLRTPEQVREVWPEVTRVCRARDVQLRGSSALDDPTDGPFFRDLVGRLAERGEVRLTTLRLDGALAAYVLSFQDGPVRRMWNCRLDPALQDYGVGRIANDAGLEDALADPACSSYDWMRGEEPYKASMSDHLFRPVDLTAASHRPLWGVVQAAAGTRTRLRDVRDGGGRAGRAVAAAQPALQRLDRLR